MLEGSRILIGPDDQRQDLFEDVHEERLVEACWHRIPFMVISSETLISDESSMDDPTDEDDCSSEDGGD